MPRNRLDCAAASEIRLSHQGKDALGVVHRPGPLLTYQPMSERHHLNQLPALQAAGILPPVEQVFHGRRTAISWLPLSASRRERHP